MTAYELPGGAPARVEFSSFNARALTPKKVAESFIVPTQFGTLVRGSHTVVVGPRGSGKTTLLKMLTPEGVMRAVELGKLRDYSVGFTGVFVPTDVSWGRQLESYGKMGLLPHHSNTLSRAAFVTAVFRALIDAISFRCSLLAEPPGLVASPIDLRASSESQFVEEVARAWECSPQILSVFGLRTALSQRLIDIGKFASRERRLGAEGREERFDGFPGLDIDLVNGVAIGLDLLEQYAPETRGDRWALLFDELELAPADVRAELLAALRSVDDRLLFKLSISPYSAEMDRFISALGAMEGHDHEVVNLTYARSDQGLEFSKQLMNAVALSRGVALRRIEDFLPRDAASGASSPRGRERAVSGSARRYEAAFRKLYATDGSFREFLDESAGGLEAALMASGDERARVVRKIGPLVEARAEFRQPDGMLTRRFKTRRNVSTYAGVQSLAVALEGNPRWIIGLMNAVIDEVSARQGLNSVPSWVQTRELSRSASRFRALLATIPVPPVKGMRRRGLLPLIDTLGEYCRDSVIAGDFSADPVGSFIVDSQTPDSVLDALGIGLNTGAIVYVPDNDDQVIISSLRGKRLRLSYLLATEYGLPLRLERAVALSRALPRAIAPEVQELSLFEEGSDD